MTKRPFGMKLRNPDWVESSCQKLKGRCCKPVKCHNVFRRCFTTCVAYGYDDFRTQFFSVSETIGSSRYRYFTPGVVRWSGVSGRNNTFQTTCWMNAPERMRYAYKKSPEESYGEYGELLKEVFAQFRSFSPDVLSVA